MVRTLPTTRVLVGMVVIASVVVVGAPTAATALSCAAHPNASPRAIAEGTEELAGEGTFPERYDGAIFGTVRSKQTQDDGDRPDYGRTDVVVDVTGTFGPALEGETVVVQDDPGWLMGHPFEVGTHYFIPYVDTDEEHYSFVCDPIAEVPPGAVPRLVEVAEQNGWASDIDTTDDGPSEPSAQIAGVQPPTGAGPPSGEAAGGGDTWPPALLGLLALASLAAVAVWRRHDGRVSPTTPTG